MCKPGETRRVRPSRVTVDAHVFVSPDACDLSKGPAESNHKAGRCGTERVCFWGHFVNV